MAVLQREYGISAADALTQYSEDQIQLYLAQLPFDRIVNPNFSKDKVEAKTQYMEQFCDRKVYNIDNLDEKIKLLERKAEIKILLRNNQDNIVLKKELEMTNEQLKKLAGE